MTELPASLAFFHFLRPAWLLLILPALLLWWLIRRRATVRPTTPAAIAPHLAAALTVGRSQRLKLLPIDGIALILVLLSMAAAGPTWSRIANPLVANTAPLAVVLNLSQSMQSTDIAPSRLERAKHKILDLLATRAGARTALIAYAGSAHRVVPLTEDPEVLKPFIEGLDPEVMPEAGRNASAALALAQATLAEESLPGAILFITDELEGADLPAIAEHSASDQAPLLFLSLGGLERVPDAIVVGVSADDSDLREIERRVAAAYQDALAGDDRLQWNDRGWLLAWPVAWLSLLWFRRGRTMQWCLLLGVMSAGVPVSPAHAAGLTDWFLTPDQQGRLAYEDKRFADAADHFQDPMWKGYALSLNGKYVEAAEVFARLSTPQAAFAEGVAYVKGREYRRGIEAFERALERDPANADAATNLELARMILDYLESAREQSDTGEGSEGADDIRFDKESEGGQQQALTAGTRLKLESAEQWMRGVDTQVTDYLRIRFALEAAGGNQ